MTPLAIDFGQLDIGSVAAWMALVVAVVLGARGGIQRSTIAALKEQNSAYEGREIKHQEEQQRLKAQHEDEQRRTQAALQRLGQRNDVLEDLVLRRAETADVVNALNAHDAEAAKRHEGTIAVLTSMQTAQQNRAEQEGRMVTALLAVSSQLENFKADGT